MTEVQKQSKIVDNFMKSKNWEGLCGYWMVEDEKGPNLVIVIDVNWLVKVHFHPEMVAKRFRQEVRDEILKWTGLDAYVGSTARDCDKFQK